MINNQKVIKQVIDSYSDKKPFTQKKAFFNDRSSYNKTKFHQDIKNVCNFNENKSYISKINSNQIKLFSSNINEKTLGSNCDDFTNNIFNNHPGINNSREVLILIYLSLRQSDCF